MAISIRTNVASLSAQRRLSHTTAGLQKTYEKLSSGLRIVRASDDAAGLALADSLRADQKIATVAIRNANDGISLVTIADAALEEIGNTLSRMAELSEQAANGTLTASQRSALDLEFVSLGSEVQRIAVSTEFNGLALLSNSSSVSIQVGLRSDSSSQISISGVQGTLNSMGLASSGSARLTYSLNGASAAAGQLAAQTALEAVTRAVSSLSSARGTLGAAESRLTVAVNNLQVMRESLAGAESQIRDVDIAYESANLVRLNILQQAASAVLAQANQQPQLALALLQ